MWKKYRQSKIQDNICKYIPMKTMNFYIKTCDASDIPNSK